MKGQTKKLGRESSAHKQRKARIAKPRAKTRNIGNTVADEGAAELPAGRNIIVAIGINSYQHQPQLENPINDAQAMLALFKQYGFQELIDVPSLVADDATRHAIAGLPTRLARELTPDDNLLLFYAGHGEKIETQAPDPDEPGKMRTHRAGYLIPVDGPENCPGDWISLEWFLGEMAGLPARHVFVVLDACKSGIALSNQFKFKGGDESASIRDLQRRSSRRVLTSAMHDQKAAEGGSGSGHSLFAEAIIAAIRNCQADRDGKGYVKSWDVFSCVQEQVSSRAQELYQLRQTPDYGALPGDGGGDLVIPLGAGAFHRLVETGMRAMLCRKAADLQASVNQLVAANPEDPSTLYLQFRLRFMQGDIDGAAELVTTLWNMKLPPGTLPLSNAELEALSTQLVYWKPVLSLPNAELPVEIKLLTGKDRQTLRETVQRRSAAEIVYQIPNANVAQFQATNTTDQPIFLYYITVVPTGRIKIGPLLNPATVDDLHGLAAHASGLARFFRIRGFPGSVTEMRILASPQRVGELLHPPTMANLADPLTATVLSQLRVQTILEQVPESAAVQPINVQKIVDIFSW